MKNPNGHHWCPSMIIFYWIKIWTFRTLPFLIRCPAHQITYWKIIFFTSFFISDSTVLRKMDHFDKSFVIWKLSRSWVLIKPTLLNPDHFPGSRRRGTSRLRWLRSWRRALRRRRLSGSWSGAQGSGFAAGLWISPFCFADLDRV